MNNILKFSVDKMELIEEVNKYQFAKVKLYAFASGNNAHNRPLSEETLKRSASTIYDKPLVYVYDKYTDDIGGHDPLEVPCGFVPKENNPIEFVTMDDGRLMLTVNAMIWKRYSGQVLDLFARDGMEKPVSVEIHILEEKENEDGSIEILDLCYMAITILGTFVKPAIDLARAEILEFSSVKQEYEKSFSYKIPNIIKENVKKGNLLKKSNSKGVTAINSSIANQLLKNDCINIDVIHDIIKFSQKTKSETVKYLLGGKEGFEWAENVIKENEDMSIKFAVNEKLGKSPKIEIKNSKEDAIMSGSWSGTDAGFLNKLLEASNHASLINEAYLIVDGNSSEDLSVNDVHYPHHTIKGDTLVVNARGIQSAFARARQQGISTGSVLSHIKKHYKELGLNMDNFEEFGLSKDDYDYMFAKNDKKEVQEVAKSNIEEKDNKVEEMTSDINTEATASAELNEKQAEVNKELTDEEKIEEASAVETDNLVKEDKMEDSTDEEKTADEKGESEEVEMSFEDLKAMYEDLKMRCHSMESEKEVYLAENEDLKKFKAGIEDKEKMAKVEYTLADVLDSMPKDKMEELREDSKNFSLETLSIWENKVKAEAFTFSKGKDNKDGFIRMGLPHDAKPVKKGLWDKI